MSRIILANWLRDFLGRRTLHCPTGSALFEYRVTDSEFDQLRHALAGRVPRLDSEAAAFCLYAAEWWRRHGQGFKWEGLLESLAIDVPYVEFYAPVEAGLRYWKRTLRIGRASNDIDRTWRDFVGTLSREGGLPLQLLLNAGTSLHRFFGRLLQERYASGAMNAEVAAAAAHLLPEAWRHRDIYELAASLVNTLWKLRELVEPSDEPVAELDRVRPDWKENLPVLIDNDVACALIKGLVQDAHAIVVAGRPVLVIETKLTRRENAWALERIIEPPRKMTPKQVEKLLGVTSRTPPRRLQLVVEYGGTPLPLAVITQWETDGPYDVELLVSTPVISSSTAEHHLLAETRAEILGGMPLRGGDELFAGPWIFTPHGTHDDEWMLAGQGSARMRSQTVLVAVREEAHIDDASTCEVQEIGTVEFQSGHRRLLRVQHGELRVHDRADDGEVFRIEVCAPVDDAWSYQLTGDPLDGPGRKTVWTGIPRLAAESTSGLRKLIPPEGLEWRRRRAGSPWMPLSSRCVGQVVLRYAPGGVTHFLEPVQIVPAETRLELIPDSTPNRGRLRLSGANVGEAELLAVDGCSATEHRSGDVFEWTFETTTAPPAFIRIKLYWPGSDSICVTAPYPVVGVRFIDYAARPLEDNATISLENLPGCRVEALLPSAERPPVVVATLRKAPDRSQQFVRESDTWRALRRQRASGRSRLQRFSLDLHELQADIRLRLASSAEMNAHVKLSVQTSDAGEARLRVRRFPIALRVNDERDAVIVLPDKSETHLDDIIDRLQLHRTPITNPSAPPTPLSRRAAGEWILESSTEDEGACLITGHDEGRCRARPIIWIPQQEVEPIDVTAAPPATIENATKIPQTNAREHALEELLQRMVRTPGHPEWEHVLPYVHSLKTLIATTYDLLDAMVRVPTSCVFALLAGQPTLSFHELWVGFEDLSFSWDTVPVRDWIHGAEIWWKRALTALEPLEEGIAAIARDSLVQMFRCSADQITLRIPSFVLIRELINQHIFGDSPPPHSMLAFVTRGEGHAYLHTARDDALMELLRAHADDDRRWPEMGSILDLQHDVDVVLPRHLAQLQRFTRPVNKWQLSVVMAPVLAALAAAWGIRLLPEQIFAVRQLREYDVSWFQHCWQYSLAMAVGLVLENEPEHYR